MVALPLYKPQKGGGPGQGGTRTVIGQLGDSFPPFDGQGSCCQDVWSVLHIPHYLMRVMSGTLRDTQYILDQMTFKSKIYKFINLIIKILNIYCF